VLTLGQFPVQTANSQENAPPTPELFRFEVFSAVVLRVMTQYSLVNGYKSFGEPTASTLERNESIRNIIFKKGRNSNVIRSLEVDVNIEFIYGLFHDSCN
jgi:hypothetical protein